MLISSLTWSRFLVSLGIWGIVATSLFILKGNKPFSWANLRVKNIKTYCSNVLKNPVLIALTIPFFMVFISGLWSEDWGFWLHRVQLRLPFLIIPLVFANIPPLSKKEAYGLLEVALWTFCATIAVVMINYAFHTAEINKGLGEGRPMPFLKTHITFSIMASFVLMAGGHLWREGFSWKYPFEKKWIPILTLFLFIGLHFISVRSGLVSTYICLTVVLLHLIFKEKKYVLGILSFTALLSIPVIAYYCIPSLRQRIDYAIWDLGKYRENQIATYSDAQRIVSYQMGWEVLKENPLIGVGAGDSDRAIRKKYAELHPELEYKMPHNGWLFNAVEVGFVGLGFYVASFFFIIFYKKGYQNLLFLLLNVAIGVGQTVDYTFEGSFGAAFYVYFVCLLMPRKEGS